MNFADASLPSPHQRCVFSCADWFELLRRTAFAPETEFVELSSGAGARLPLVRGKEGRLKALSTYYTPLFAPIQEVAHPDLRSITLEWAAQIADMDSAAIDLEPLAADAAWVRALEEALRAKGYHTERYFRFGNWYHRLATDENFASYFAARPSALRNTVKRASRRLAHQAGFSLTIHTDPGPELETAIADYTRIYNASWKHPEPWSHFIPGLCRLAARKGWLRLGIAHIGNTPAAAQIWLVCAGVASIYKLAYDEQFKALSIGSVLTARLMERVIDSDRVVEIDYLVGDELYKRDWMSARRSRWGLVAYSRRHLRGNLAIWQALCGRLLRRVRRLPDDPYMADPTK